MKKVVRIINRLFIIIPTSGLFIGICSAEIGEEPILNRFIIEGKSIAGVNIGDHESDIYKAIGFPDKLGSTSLLTLGLRKGAEAFDLWNWRRRFASHVYQISKVDVIWLFDYPGKISYKGQGGRRGF